MSDPAERIQTHPEGHDRLPDGQFLTPKWPVLTYGPTPKISTAEWRMRIWGAVDRELTLDWAALHALPKISIVCDFHCVTTWSRYDMTMTGFRVRDVLALASVQPQATHVMQHAYGGYTTNNALDVMLSDDVLVVVEVAGEPLEREHGGPARVHVPKRWAWKGAKWVNGFELLTADKRGFWEVNGYHNHGDPWGEGGERYSHQERASRTRKEGNELRRKDREQP